MRIAGSFILAFTALGWSQTPEFTTKEAVLARYQEALGGVEAVRKVQSESRHGQVEAPGMKGRITFVSYAKPFKWLARVTMPDGAERTNGFDGEVSWTSGPKGAEIDKSVPVESVRRDSVGYRFQSDDQKGLTTIVVYEDYKSFGGPLVPTKETDRQGDQSQVTTVTSVNYEPIADSLFDLPGAVKALLK